MSIIDKQWLQQKIADMEATRDEIPFGLDEDDSNTLAAMKLALASLETEAVAYADPQAFRNFKAGAARREWMWRNPGEDLIPLFTAPPAPVSVPAAMEMDDDFDSAFEHGKAVGWNAYRAAMLQGAEPVTTAYKLPANTPCKDAPEHIWLQTAGIWPENGEFSELTWCSDNQHPDDTLYVRADVVPGNSPVIPDGSEDTKRLDWLDAQNKRLNEYYGTTYGWKFDANFQRNAMMLNDSNYPVMNVRQAIDAAIAAAPQQEVKP